MHKASSNDCNKIVIRQCLSRLVIINCEESKQNMGKISNLINIEFDSEPVYGDNDKYIKTKIKMYENRVKKNFQGKKVL